MIFSKLFKPKKVLELTSPIDGEVVSLEEVPDPVFSEKMMGEGIAIIPEKNELFSPIAGEIIQIFPSKHAIGIRDEHGLEWLMHIGLETVELEGKGFDLYVEVGDKVNIETKLIEVDLAYLTEKEKNPIIPIILMENNQVKKLENQDVNRFVKQGELILKVYLK